MGQVIVVTGAGSGIGLAISRELLRRGHDVVLAGRRADALTAAADGHPHALPLAADVTSPDSVRDLFRVVADTFGRVDVLVNNAGVFGPAARIDQLGDADWRHVWETNVSGAVYCAREASTLMIGQSPPGGRIINNGSLSAHRPRPQSLAYTVTKHAVSGLTASMALDLRDHNIAVTQIDIGNAATAMTAGIGHAALQPDGSRRAESTIDAGHVATTVAHIAELPLDVAIPTITVMATAMPYAGRG
ncbi:SDR family oxidoreductase [Mycolicibacterium goodii]|uniref:Short-chain dehydrogenase n=1 Tax=Mycolicibacterium goodii TaxID=134601 RepID=A0A0K0X3E5_MYCGD|nr:short-chain dehydrogenase [Mycolicibacterium goodii]